MWVTPEPKALVLGVLRSSHLPWWVVCSEKKIPRSMVPVVGGGGDGADASVCGGGGCGEGVVALASAFGGLL